jgi:hypothetical protein
MYKKHLGSMGHVTCGHAVNDEVSLAAVWTALGLQMQ